MDRPVITVANRLPVERTASGWKLSPGGLVTALQPVMASRAGVWVGWDGGSSGIPANADDLPTGLEAVSLPGALARDYYQGFANRSLWPLLHNAIEHPRFERSWWAAYQSANHRFAESTGAVARERHVGHAAR